MLCGKPETLEIEHAQGVAHGACSRGGVEMVSSRLRAEPPGAEGVQGVDGRLVVGRPLPPGQFALRQQHFRRVQRGQDGQQVVDPGISRDLELGGGEVQPGGMEPPGVEGYGREVVVAGGVELVGRQGGARAEDARQLPADELARLGRLLLVADRHLFPRAQQPAHVAVHGMERQPGHGLAVAVGEGEAEDLGGLHRVVEEQLVEVAQPEEKQGSGRQPALHLEVLLHHRRELLGGGHGQGQKTS